MKTIMMRFIFFTTIIFSALLSSTALANITWEANWIWTSNDGPKNSWVAFKKDVNLTYPSGSVKAYIAADTKYWLWINGKLVVFEGGMTGGPSPIAPLTYENAGPPFISPPSNKYYDEIEIGSYLKSGNNSIAILTWYWGQEGDRGTHIDSGKGGLIFQAQVGGTKILSDSTWKAKQHPGYKQDTPIDPSGFIAAPGIKYDAQQNLGDWTTNAWYNENYNFSSWSNAKAKGKPPTAPWNNLEKNALPPLKDHGLAYCKNYPASSFPFTTNGTDIECTLDFNKNFTPYIDIETTAGKVVQIASSHAENVIKTLYITTNGRQQFEGYSWSNGHAMVLKIPSGVKVHGIKFRWTGIGNMPGTFEASDAFYQRLWWMGRNTLYICARDNFMDTPDRERGLWIGDVADQASYLFYVLDEPGRLLLKKSIDITMKYRNDITGTFGGLAPGRRFELPAQSLQFIDQAVWQYYFNTGDAATLAFAYPRIYKYLQAWTLKSNGLINYRQQTYHAWDWVDWGLNPFGPNGNVGMDKTAIHNAWYYAALKSARTMAVELGQTAHLSFYDDTMEKLKNGFNNQYWKGSFYSSDISKFKDDRVNAMAILSGLASADKHDSIVKNVLIPVQEASPHMEWMVEDALAKTGNYKAALVRMKNRYAEQVNNNALTTLYEMFPRGGTKNHAWNAPNFLLSRHIAGIAPTGLGWKTFEVLPNMVHMTHIKQTLDSVKGPISVSMRKQSGSFSLDVSSPTGTTALIGLPKESLSYQQIKVNGQVVWQSGAFVSGVAGVSWKGENSKYLQFSVTPGNYSFVGTGQDIAPTDEPLAPGFTLAAKEYETVPIPEAMNVAFGAKGKYRYLNGVIKNITCNASTFGGDPIVNEFKQCYTQPLNALPTDFQYAAKEYGVVAITGTMDVAFGANGKYRYLTNVTQNIACNSTTFGGDPTPNIFKECYRRSASGL